MRDVFEYFDPAMAASSVFRTDDAIFQQNDAIAQYRALWAELHGKQDPDQTWFDDWLSRVPNFGCGCQDSFRKYVADNPPDFDDFYRWSVNAHNWVNKKRGAAIWTG